MEGFLTLEALLLGIVVFLFGFTLNARRLMDIDVWRESQTEGTEKRKTDAAISFLVIMSSIRTASWDDIDTVILSNFLDGGLLKDDWEKLRKLDVYAYLEEGVSYLNLGQLKQIDAKLAATVNSVLSSYARKSVGEPRAIDQILMQRIKKSKPLHLLIEIIPLFVLSIVLWGFLNIHWLAVIIILAIFYYSAATLTGILVNDKNGRKRSEFLSAGLVICSAATAIISLIAWWSYIIQFV